VTAGARSADGAGPDVVAAVAAVDFGASSIRVCRVELGGDAPVLEVVHRYSHAAVADPAGHLRWDWARLVGEMERGLEAAAARGSLASIGVDTWGVDYGLLDGRGELVAPPFSYRDSRTDGYARVVEAVGADALFATTGLQTQPFNTLFQVAAHDRDELRQARHLLTLPELLVHHLTGAITAEPSSAGTTGLVDITTGEWSAALADVVGLDARLLPPITPAGTRVGGWRGVPVHLVGGHDTASAVVAMGDRPGSGSAFVSAGTWLLVGRELASPQLSPAARAANFTNEIGALGGVRLLKNLAGAWLVEQCRTAWGDPPLVDLMDAAEALGAGDDDVHRAPAAAAAVTGPDTDATDETDATGTDVVIPGLLDVADSRFLHPDDMLAEVTGALGLTRDATPPAVVRAIVGSQAVGTARVVDQLAAITGSPVTDIAVFGGGGRSRLYRDQLVARTGLPVRQGPVEATALGNALVQGVALGLYADLADARSHLAPALLGAP
jgi:rhamnulokinase